MFCVDFINYASIYISLVNFRLRIVSN